MTAQELREGLSNFYGTTVWYKHYLNPSILYTEGVQFFAEHAGNGAYRLLDIIATELPALMKETDQPFAQITLTVSDSSAMITADDGDKNVFYRREIDYTDFPVGEWSLYLTDNVILLPSEY